MLQKLNRIKEFNIAAWVNDMYVRQAFKERGLDYDKQTMASSANYDVTGKDPVCNAPITSPGSRPDLDPGRRHRARSARRACTLAGVKKYRREGKKLGAAYVFDQALGIKVFADKAFYAIAARIRRSRRSCRSC